MHKESNKASMIKPSRQEAEEAVRTLIRWIGDNPERVDLKSTPARVAQSYENMFSGYSNTENNTFSSCSLDSQFKFDDMILFKLLEFLSFCEHHMMPIIGNITIAYLPKKKIIGLGKVQKIVDKFTRKLQIQERFTSEIANFIYKEFDARGVAVMVNGTHLCSNIKSSNSTNSKMNTSFMLGEFENNFELQNKFFSLTSCSQD